MKQDNFVYLTPNIKKRTDVELSSDEYNGGKCRLSKTVFLAYSLESECYFFIS